ncbi:glycosyltransferase [Propionicimonas sp.]|uniref:glycosyltransferase n=1 Tax=Propionicimonas sp. TaxID=1955623 RepID=UPI0017C825AD|nr:glycosyltransferase [Propionicimonas sp.]MBU3976585.1 glycosyltransferase [Actinomycetota bacterium]MBA3020415.1 glycosyltransferase [Propionicimonas sp.]MBU3986588.1 glycosyltransferase [Actinomycetota bacterium]MBU4007260.1 glycosyltransferase [Actinomycetota bacterium]MBU4065013.1 glycosyltransferase [Actinomycetota bacterium]
MATHDLALVDERDPQTRRQQTRNPYSPVMILLTLIATLGVLGYSVFLLNPASRGDLLPYSIVIFAESVLVVHALLSMWTILAGAKSPRDNAYYNTRRHLFGKVASPDPDTPILLGGREVSVVVFITCYGEPVDVIRRTAEAARQINGRHSTFILDDGGSDAVREMAADVGVSYLRRLSSGGAKAGNVNHALSQVKTDYFCIFDADFVPSRDFITETAPFFIDTNVAFVQTPQSYGNLRNFVSRGAGYMQTVFYRFVQRGRNHFNAAFCVGTNVIFRRAAVDDVGGIYTDSKSEDVWTSMLLHERGWRSVYIPDILAVGDAPDTIEAYTKQQLRWATGGFEILFTHNPLSPKRHLTMDQRLMYTVTATHYLTGIAPGLLLLVPALEIFLDLRPMVLGTSPWQWALAYAGFYLMQILLASFTFGSFRGEVLLLSTASFPIYHQAFINAFTGKEQQWHVTGTNAGRSSPFNFIRPQVYLFVFLVLTSVVAIWRDLNNAQFSLATAWNLTNTAALGVFMVVAVREAFSRQPSPARASEAAVPVVASAPRRLVVAANSGERSAS